MRRSYPQLSHVRERHRGQAIPILGLTLLVLLGFSALAVDGALAFAWRRNTANAADGAALLGARALLDVRQNGGDSGDISDVLDLYLADQLDVADPVYTAFYVNGTGARLTQIGDSGNPPSAARGVAIDVRYTFETFLMRVMGQETVTVGATAVARVGQLGAASGPEVIPLGLDQTAADIIRANRNRDVVLDLYGEMQEQNEEWNLDRIEGRPAPDENLEYDISADQLRSVNLIQGDSDPPTLGGGSNCNRAADNDTLKFWWCNGSDDPIRATVPGVDPPQGTSDVDWNLRGMIQSRVERASRTQRVLVPVVQPVLNDDGDWEYYIDYFMAVELMSFNRDEGPGSYNTLVVRYLGNYVAAGGIVGFTSGEVRGDSSWWTCDACAINLVRER
jgi:hypothetical protein